MYQSMPNKCDAYAYILIINSLQVSEQYIICTWNIIIISFVVMQSVLCVTNNVNSVLIKPTCHSYSPCHSPCVASPARKPTREV